MKRKILALVLVAVMLFSTVPAFAASNYTFAVDSSKVGSAKNPLTVTYDKGTIDYVSLGDSVAYGFGINGFDFNQLFDFTQPNRYAKEIDGSYPQLIKSYLSGVKTGGLLSKTLNVNYKQRAACVARIEDMCTFIDAKEFPGDGYYENMVKGFMLNGCYGSGIPTDRQLNEDFCTAVEDADFITITAGGNNFLGYILFSSMWKIEGIDADLSKYYGTAAEIAFDLIKQATIVRAEALDAATILKKKEETYTEQVKEVFDILEKLLYTMGAFMVSAPELMDIIHEKNPDAVIAFTGMPDAYAEYDIKIGSIVIDLEKIVKPMFSMVNTVFKNASEDRSDYVRYIDISGVELIKPTEGLPKNWDGKTIELSTFLDFFKNNLAISHPSELGHKQIADKIMANFTFEASNNKTFNVRNIINNVWTKIMSRLGITKITNLLSSISKFSLLDIIKVKLS